MANPTPDFVQVQLTAAGQAFAGSATLIVSNGRRSFSFKGTEQLKVEKSYEWNKFLSMRQVPKSGQLMFEIVPAPTLLTPSAAPIAEVEAAPKPEAPVPTVVK